jgi:O-antigen ligase
MELFETHKWFGIGWENFSDFSRAVSASGKPNQGHNVFLQLLAEVGIVGFIPVILINLYYLGVCFRRNRLVIRNLNAQQKRTFVFGTCRCCSMAFMIFYYLFWFTGNALYDIPLLYTWLVSIWLCVSINKQNIVQSSNL